MDAFAGLGVDLRGPAFALQADGRTFTPDAMIALAPDRWRSDGVEVALDVRETPDGSRAITLRATGVRRVHEVCLVDHDVVPAPDEIHNHRWYDFGGLQQSTAVFVRYATGGLFACYANPFGTAEIEGDHVRLSYRPGMDVEGTFVSDPLVIGPFEREGVDVRRDVLPGRDIVLGKVPGYASGVGPYPVRLDRGEVRAVRRAVAARVPWEPARVFVHHWDWGENLFRLQIDDESTRAIYDRVMELCADLGVELLCLTPGHRGGYVHVDRDLVTDDWQEPTEDGPWQSIMWLGMGPQFGRGEWEPGDEPAALREVLRTTRERDLKPVAYTNPQYLWLRDESWRVQWPGAENPRGGYTFACLGHAKVREWLIENAARFIDAYGLAGLSFDFVFWVACHATDHGHEPGDDSRYAQWDGYRRLLRALRAADTNVWLEGLIGSQSVLPWGSLDLTHPHQSMGDNQPQWMPAWPDTSVSRVNGNYQRRTAYWYRNFAFLPSYKVPGLTNHQANRMRYAPVERGWDWDGARYGLLSAIMSGPSTITLCFLPGWDADEWSAMRERDGAFFRRWIGFAREHADVLAQLEDLYDEPRPGAVDGTVALDDDGCGFVFLANPDFEPLTAEVPLAEDRLLRELHPVVGRLWDGVVTVDPHEVQVLEVVRSDTVELPALIGVAGRVDGDGRVTEAFGTPGTVVDAAVRRSTSESRPTRVRFASDGVTPTLGPWRDAGGSVIKLEMLDGRVRATAEWVPGVAMPELLRAMEPGVPPQGDEVLQPWSDPSRLRIFVELIEPAAVSPRLLVNGEEVELRVAYVGTYADVTDPAHVPLENNMLGWYADLTDRVATTEDLSRPWTFELEVELVRPGQLRGLRVAALPRRRTDRFEVLP